MKGKLSESMCLFVKMTITTKPNSDGAVPLRDHGPTVRLQKTCTGALLRAGPELLQSHYGFKEGEETE